MSTLRPAAAAVLSVVVVATATPAWAGYLNIAKPTVALNRVHPPAELSQGEFVELTFKYSLYRYSGKPHVYAFFRLVDEKSKDAKLFAAQVNYAPTRKKGRALFRAPNALGKYKLCYLVVPFVSNDAFKDEELLGALSPKRAKQVASYYRRNPRICEDIAEVTVTGDAREDFDQTEAAAVMLRGTASVRTALAERRPPVFKWTLSRPTRGRTTKIQYAHRLSPVEDWSPWSANRQAEYVFLRPAGYQFEVKARYVHDGKTKETPPAVYPFQVDQEIFQASKGFDMLMRAVAASPAFVRRKHYNRSRALVIGIERGEDPFFQPLPFVDNDLRVMTKALNDSGFSVQKVDGAVSTKRLTTDLTKFLADSETDDRVVIYYSGHGTSKGEAGFLVTSDCDSRRMTQSCFALTQLKSIIFDAYKTKKLRHVLVLLDSCQAGLGVLSKSGGSTPVQELVRFPGAHLFSAGLPDEEAIAVAGASLFTRALADGIRGQADIFPKDRVVTLAELHAYVQNRVSIEATKNQHRQTPVMGRIAGAGEMIFIAPKP